MNRRPPRTMIGRVGSPHVYRESERGGRHLPLGVRNAVTAPPTTAGGAQASVTTDGAGLTGGVMAGVALPRVHAIPATSAVASAAARGRRRASIRRG